MLPGALYELGVAVTVSLSVAPQLVESVQRVRRARKLRGGTGAGIHALRQIAIPVLEDALERSLHLAAGMDSRGYGRTGGATRRARRVTGVFMITGMSALCLGSYGLLDPSVSDLLGVPALAIGSLLCVVGLALGGRRVRRSRYRPDPWTTPEWVVALSGLVPAVVLLAGTGFSATSLNPSTDPLTWPSLPLVPAVAIVVASVAAIAAPPPLRPARAPKLSAPPTPSGDRDETEAPEDRPGRLGVPA